MFITGNSVLHICTNPDSGISDQLRTYTLPISSFGKANLSPRIRKWHVQRPSVLLGKDIGRYSFSNILSCNGHDNNILDGALIVFIARIVLINKDLQVGLRETPDAYFICLGIIILVSNIAQSQAFLVSVATELPYVFSSPDQHIPDLFLH